MFDYRSYVTEQDIVLFWKSPTIHEVSRAYQKTTMQETEL